MFKGKYIKRTLYLDKLKNFIDKPIIKVIIGMRRVGKSTIMKLLIQELLKSGISKESILYINKESLEFENIKNYFDLYKYTTKYFKDKKHKRYVFIDEIQEIESWEKAVASFLSDNIADIFISGSNSKLMSSEIATLLSGRYIEIPIYPLTFKEFLLFRKNKSDIETEFKNYLKYGGLPAIHSLEFEDEVIFEYLNSIMNTVLYKDIITRNKIRSPSVLEKIVQYLFDNIGNITTAKRISNYFKSQKLNVSIDTTLNYIKYIESAFLVDRLPRYDIKGKKSLEFYDKIFLNDIGLRHGFIGYREKDINGLFENVVYSELKARGYKVKVGVFDNLEIDFVAEKQNELKYIQVCYSLADINTQKREFNSLLKIKDNYEKMVISMDRFFQKEINGINHYYLIDFLSA